jgi:hypothetical protein
LYVRRLDLNSTFRQNKFPDTVYTRFTVGDKVIFEGLNGVVEEIDPKMPRDFCVLVRFEDSSGRWFDKDGFCHVKSSAPRSIYEWNWEDNTNFNISCARLLLNNAIVDEEAL